MWKKKNIQEQPTNMRNGEKCKDEYFIFESSECNAPNAVHQECASNVDEAKRELMQLHSKNYRKKKTIQYKLQMQSVQK